MPEREMDIGDIQLAHEIKKRPQYYYATAFEMYRKYVDPAMKTDYCGSCAAKVFTWIERICNTHPIS